MLPSYDICIDRLNAYFKTGYYKEQIRKINSLPDLKIGFKRFWNYKLLVQQNGGSILDDVHIDDTSAKLHDFLDDWGMREPGIAEVKKIKTILVSIRGHYNQLRNIELGERKLNSLDKQIAAIYDGLNGITNKRDFPKGDKSYITGKSKTLLAIWGQTPGFDSLTRHNLRVWNNQPLINLKYGKRDYTSQEFCDMILELDEWVFKWPARNENRNFKNSMTSLCNGLPVGRIIDMIFNWEFEYEPLRYYLNWQQDSGVSSITMNFKQLNTILGFKIPADPWVDIQKCLKKGQGKRRLKGKQGWVIANLNTVQQTIDFIH